MTKAILSQGHACGSWPDRATTQQDKTNLKREGVMPAKSKWTTGQYPQSVGNVALAEENLGMVQQPTAKLLSLVPGGAQDMAEDESEVDALAPATGIMVGIGLSIMLWSLIILVISLMR
jgi:hypothetical protein